MCVRRPVYFVCSIQHFCINPLVHRYSYESSLYSLTCHSFVNMNHRLEGGYVTVFTCTEYGTQILSF